MRYSIFSVIPVLIICRDLENLISLSCSWFIERPSLTIYPFFRRLVWLSNWLSGQVRSGPDMQGEYDNVEYLEYPSIKAHYTTRLHMQLETHSSRQLLIHWNLSHTIVNRSLNLQTDSKYSICARMVGWTKTTVAHGAISVGTLALIRLNKLWAKRMSQSLKDGRLLAFFHNEHSVWQKPLLWPPSSCMYAAQWLRTEPRICPVTILVINS